VIGKVSNFKQEKPTGTFHLGKPKVFSPSNSASTVDTAATLCLCCHRHHNLSSCSKFQGLPIEKRVEIVKEKCYCFRCSNTGHVSRNCKKSTACDIGGCRSHHHRLLHGAPSVFPKKEDSFPNTVATITHKDDQVALSQEPVSFVGVTCPKENLTLLPIVPMEIVGKDGNGMEANGLLD